MKKVVVTGLALSSFALTLSAHAQINLTAKCSLKETDFHSKTVFEANPVCPLSVRGDGESYFTVCQWSPDLKLPLYFSYDLKTNIFQMGFNALPFASASTSAKTLIDGSLELSTVVNTFSPKPADLGSYLDQLRKADLKCTLSAE